MLGDGTVGAQVIIGGNDHSDHFQNRLGLLYHLTLFHNEAEQFVPMEHRMPIQVND